MGGIRAEQTATICSKVCQEIHETLQADQPSTALILQRQCGLHEETVKSLEKNPEFLMHPAKNFLPAKFPKSADPYLNKQQCRNIKADLQKLDKLQSSFSLDDSSASQMMRLVVDSVTTHIIKTANSTLVSPAMSMAAGSIVAKISAELQDRFLVDESQNTFEQNENKKKVSSLKKKSDSELSDEDRQFLKAHDTKNTFASQINYNAKDYMIAWQRREIAEKSMAKREAEQKSDANSKSELKSAAATAPISEELKSSIIEVLEGAPADEGSMLSLAAENGVDIKLVDDPKYVPTPEDIASGKKIVLFKKSEVPGEIGHYSLKDNEGNPVKTESSNNDCGYAVIAKLTGKDVDSLRCERAKDMLENPERFKEIQTVVKWVKSRHPDEANNILGVGGRINQKDKKSMYWLFTGNTNPFKSDEVKELIESELTADEGPGYIYIYKKGGNLSEDGKSVTRLMYTDYAFKIGMTIDPSERPQKTAQNNKEVYAIIDVIPVMHRRRTERVIHTVLQGDHAPKRFGNGKTEWFQTPERFASIVAYDARDAVERQWQTMDLKMGWNGSSQIRKTNETKSNKGN